MDQGKIGELLGLLWGALRDAGLDEEARRVKQASDVPLRGILDCLSALERSIVDLGAWKAVVLCKATIGGKDKEHEFVRQCWTLQGLI